MIKMFIITSLSAMLLFSCSTKNNQKEIEEALAEFDNMSLEEAKEYLKEKNSEFQRFAAFFSGDYQFGSGEVKKYTTDEESYDKLPTFMKPEDIEQNNKQYFTHAYLAQEYKYPQSEIRIKVDDYDINDPVGASYQANKIFFSDGSIDDSKQEIGRWIYLNTAKTIDSVHVTAEYSYAEGFDQYEFKDKVNFKGGSIKVAKMQDNMLKLTLTGKAKDYEKIVALNDEGKVLSFSSSSSETKGADKVGKAYADAFEKLANKADDFKSVEEIKKAVKKTFAKLPSLHADVETTYTGFFKGNISSVMVYIPTNTVSKEVDFTLVNKNVSTQKLIYAFNAENEKFGFLNQSGEFAIQPTYENLTQENDLYYYHIEEQDDDNEDLNEIVYFLDTENTQLIKIPDIQSGSIMAVKKTCISVEKNEKYALWNAQGKAVTPYIYDWINNGTENPEELLIVTIDNKCGIINTEGQTVLAVNYNRISNFTNGRALVKKSGNSLMFIDETGKQVIPLTQYSNAYEFSDGLAVVNKDDKYGFIDTEGKLVLPCVYERAESFQYGVSLVRVDGLYGLINKAGHFIVPATAESYSMSGSKKRTYYLNRVKYNEYGNVIEEKFEEDEDE